MSDYKAVSDALAAGSDPGMLCQTCPWDRNCITPPEMSRAEVEAKLAESMRDDDRRAAEARELGKAPPMPLGGLLTAVVMGGRDTSAQVCPVFALRLRSGAGRALADSVRSAMQKWDDNS